MSLGDVAARVLAGATGVLADVPPIEQPPAPLTSILPLALAGLLLVGGVVVVLVRLGRGRARGRRAPPGQA
jgi:hypothetical protein